MKIDDSFSLLLNDIECSLALSSVNMRELFRGKCENDDLAISTSDNNNGKNKFRMTSKDIDDLIIYAKNFDNELKSFVEKRKLREKIVKRNQEKSMAYKRKSSFPPIWNDDKLDDYISSIIDEILLETDHEEDSKKSEKINQSAKSSAGKVNGKEIAKEKRNVGINIKTQKKREKISKKSPITQMEFDKDTIKAKVNSSGKISKDIIKLDTGKTLFPARGTDEVEKGIFNNLKFKRGSSTSLMSDKKSIISRKSNELENAESLKCSTTTFTTTNGGSNSHQHNEEGLYVVANDSMTTKNSASKKKQQNNINIQVLPVLSIKGECRIQSIYKIEILPKVSAIPSNSNDDNVRSTPNANIKYCEYIHNDIKKTLNENETRKPGSKSSRSASLDNSIDKIECNLISTELQHKIEGMVLRTQIFFFLGNLEGWGTEKSLHHFRALN